MTATRRGRPPAGPERRNALVQAAYRCLAEGGFERLRMRDVAAGVGIDHSSIHHHFPTKQDLVVAVVDYTTRQFWSTTPPDGGPVERLRHHLATLRQKIVDEPELHIVLRELDLRARRDPELLEIIAGREEGWRSSLRTLLTGAAAAGALAPGVDPATGAELVIATVKGASLASSRAGDVIELLDQLLIRA
ncbi:TetR/AcrR family transcriptional regulator [Nonomuraea endophytica]|uniref:TetR/AcrR family transcriptional repressor of nem operon n=1 Tax=Nonomuraea endophytica TaxID=714136 RepID=A0A7W8EEK7_9ACTN|nr:TetR/AcrR family transcriptional regulator [Nonomuraea endophytica]MBB5077785.1 TetR/AcrR family transcriptional repressor of nem operon [Nonomuraea endophytica]